MRRSLLALLVVLLLSSISPSVGAQEVPPQLTKVVEALECVRKEQMSGWSRERVPPITSSENVLIEMWVSGGRRVKVSILPYQSEAAAIESMQRFVATETVKKVQGLGDEAYAWGYSDEIALRKGSFTVFVSAISDIDRLLLMVEEAERSGLRRTEQIALNKNFARMMSAILANPAGACGLYQRF
jgi:hypothetical protein